MHILGLDDVRANMLGYAVGIVCSFTLNKYWTFSSRQRVSRELGRFLLVTAVAYAANLATLIVLTRYFRTNRDLAQALAILPYVAVGYVGSRFFAFRQQVPGTV